MVNRSVGKAVIRSEGYPGKLWETGGNSVDNTASTGVTNKGVAVEAVDNILRLSLYTIDNGKNDIRRLWVLSRSMRKAGEGEV